MGTGTCCRTGMGMGKFRFTFRGKGMGRRWGARGVIND